MTYTLFKKFWDNSKNLLHVQHIKSWFLKMAVHFKSPFLYGNIVFKPGVLNPQPLQCILCSLYAFLQFFGIISLCMMELVTTEIKYLF
jgi:hypothetical protein